MMHRLEVTNPFDGSPVGEVKLSSASEVETALATAETVSYTHLTLPTICSV